MINGPLGHLLEIILQIIPCFYALRRTYRSFMKSVNAKLFGVTDVIGY